MTITKAQERELDKLWAMAVKERAGNRCERCMKATQLQAHHCIGRRNKTVRHIVSNGCCLCAGCHFFAEQNGISFAQWIIARRGGKWWNNLQALSREIKVSKNYELLKAALKQYIDGGINAK